MGETAKLKDADGSSSAATPPAKPRGKFVVAVLAIIGFIAGAATLFENIDKIQIETRKFFSYVGVYGKDIPILQGHDTSWMGGGHNPSEQCDPMLNKYRAENQSFNINPSYSQAHRKDVFGRVEYKFSCNYFATPK